MWSAKFNVTYHRPYFTALRVIVLVLGITEFLFWISYTRHVGYADRASDCLIIGSFMDSFQFFALIPVSVEILIHLWSPRCEDMFRDDIARPSTTPLRFTLIALFFRLSFFIAYKTRTTRVDDTYGLILCTGSLVLQISGCLIYAFLLYEFKRARLAWEQLEKQEEINIYLTFY